MKEGDNSLSAGIMMFSLTIFNTITDSCFDVIIRRRAVKLAQRNLHSSWGIVQSLLLKGKLGALWGTARH